MGSETYWEDYMKYINLCFYQPVFSLLANFVKNDHCKIKDLYLTLNGFCKVLRKIPSVFQAHLKNVSEY